MKLKILVAGTGRCGSTYMAHLLTQMGLPCGHEAIFTTDGLEEAKKRLSKPETIKFSECTENSIPLWTEPWDIVADSSYLSAPFLNHLLLKETKIINVIRNPLEVIASYVFDAKYFTNDFPPITQKFQEFIKKHLPIVYDNNLDPINRTALFYIEWNNLIKQNKNVFHFNVESHPEVLANYLNVPCHVDVYKKINSWNHNKRPILSYSDIQEPLRRQLKEFKYMQKLFL